MKTIRKALFLGLLAAALFTMGCETGAPRQDPGFDGTTTPQRDISPGTAPGTMPPPGTGTTTPGTGGTW